MSFVQAWNFGNDDTRILNDIWAKQKLNLKVRFLSGQLELKNLKAVVGETKNNQVWQNLQCVKSLSN